MRAEDGTRRGKSTPGMSLPQGMLVNSPKFSVDKRYKVFDCPWNTHSLNDPKFSKSSLYVSDKKYDKAKEREDSLPVMLLTGSQLQEWESGNRELLNVITVLMETGLQGLLKLC